MPAVFPKSAPAEGSRTSRARGIPTTLACFVLTLCVPVTAQAVPSEFDGLVQSNSARLDPMEDKVFKRQQYHSAGASTSFKGWVWDPDLGDFVYTVVPGETWAWRWLDARTGEVLAYHSLRFEGGEDLCWDNGWCGGFEGWWAAAPLQCMAEDQRIRVEIYHNGLLLGADSFRPTRFVPSLDASQAESIEPRRTRSGSGEATDVSVRVTDDLGCGQPLGGAVARIASTVKGGTNGQLYLVQGDRGTGRFSSLGYNAVLNPDTPPTPTTR